MLGQRVPSAVSSSILQGLLVAQYDTVEQAVVAALEYQLLRVEESSDGDDDDGD